MLALALPAAAFAAGERGARVPPGGTGGGPALTEVNGLNDVAWRPLAQEAEASSDDWLERTFEGDIASGSGRAGGARWSFSLKLDDVDSRVDLSQPAGFRRMSVNGFEIGFPRRGTWRLGAAARLRGRAKVKVGGQTIFSWSPSVRMSLTLPRFSASVSGSLGPNLEDPRLAGGGIGVDGRVVGGDGALPNTIGVEPEPASGTPGQNPGFAGKVRFPLDLPGLHASFEGRIRAILEPAVPFDELADGLDVELPEHLGPEDWGIATGHVLRGLQAPFSEVRITLEGRITVRLDRVGKRSTHFKLTFGIPFFTSPEVQTALLAVRALSGLQPRFGVVGPPTPPPAAGLPARLAAAADELERTMPPFLPAGLVHSLDRQPARVGRPRSPPNYGGDEDAAIWTGHYLAAQAFRYAATRDPAALDRARTLLDAIERLFTVTQDAVVVSGRRRPVGGQFIGTRTFARAALPASASSRVTDGDFARRRCHYERPEGGWQLEVAPAAPRRFARYADLQREYDRLPEAQREAAVIEPVGTVWYGIGCGENHPVSRDQYAGVFMGLTFLHELVDVPALRARAAKLIDGALDFLIDEDWIIKTPPGKRGQNYWFNWDKQIAMLRMGVAVNPGRYRDRYLKAVAALPLAWLPNFFSGLDPLHQYYKFNLGTAALLPALWLEGNEAIRPGFEFSHDVLNLPLRGHRNAYFTMGEILAARGGERQAEAQSAAASNPNISKAQEVTALLGQWLARRDAVVGDYRRPLGRVPDPDYLSRLWPADVSLYRKIDGSTSCVSRFPLAVDKRIGKGMDFMWQRQPFQTGIRNQDCNSRAGRTSPSDIERNGSRPQREAPGVDFLLPYWMGVHLGVIPRPAPARR